MGTTATKEAEEHGFKEPRLATEADILSNNKTEPSKAKVARYCNLDRGVMATTEDVKLVPYRSQPIAVPSRTADSPTAWCGSYPSNESRSFTNVIPPLENGEGADEAVVVPGSEGSPTRRFLFVWTGDAREVSVAGSFNEWGDPIKLRQVDNNLFRIELELEAKAHEYKYIVDGKWKHDPLAPVVASGLGSLNNVLKLNKSTAVDDGVGEIDSLEREVDPFSGRQTPPGDYSQTIPNFGPRDAPPLLPPHLKEATLNSEPLSDDPSDLPVPNHVVLDHLYAQSVRDNVLVLGATHRYKEKYVTTVLYKPL